MANNQTMMVTLRFNSDTSQAKKDIQSLIQEIGKLSTDNLRNGLTGNLSTEMKTASVEVQKFATMLRDAVNVNTGKLDLTKLNASLKASNTDLKKMSQSFSALGTEGVQSFANIVKQINAAEIPLRQTNKLVDKLWLSLKNTVNWQISSSAIHTLVGGFESAFRYAEDLNESLNNIRIVTRYGADKMAVFAKEANKAAKALSTTTVDYTDASLIYYQQGNGQFLNFFVDKIF